MTVEALQPGPPRSAGEPPEARGLARDEVRLLVGRPGGVRHTVFSRDISFCGDASGAIRLWLRTPRRMSFVRRVTEVYLGLEDPLRLGTWLVERGVPGHDLRAG